MDQLGSVGWIVRAFLAPSETAARHFVHGMFFLDLLPPPSRNYLSSLRLVEAFVEPSAWFRGPACDVVSKEDVGVGMFDGDAPKPVDAPKPNAGAGSATKEDFDSGPSCTANAGKGSPRAHPVTRMRSLSRQRVASHVGTARRIEGARNPCDHDSSVRPVIGCTLEPSSSHRGGELGMWTSAESR